jgi:hypothetical protein
MVTWSYANTPTLNSPEALLLSDFLVRRDWLTPEPQ